MTLILYGKSFVADVIKLRISKWEVIRDYLNGPDVTTRVLISERRREEGPSPRRGDDRSTGWSDELSGFEGGRGS